jgi:hypothetical protein
VACPGGRRLFDSVGADCSAQHQALAALIETGITFLPPAAKDRRPLADQDKRTVRSGILADILRNDEDLHTAIRQLPGEPS